MPSTAAVRIVCHPAVARRVGILGCEAIEGAVRSRLQELLGAVGLRPSLVPVIFEERPQVPDTGGLQVDLCGGAVRHVDVGDHDEPKAVGLEIFKWVYRNRDLLVTDEVAAGLWTETPGASPVPMITTLARSVVTDAVMRGCPYAPPLAACRDAVLDGCVDPEAIINAIEPAFQPAGDVRVIVSSNASAELSDEKLGAVRDEVAKRAGLPLPPLKREIDDGIGAGPCFRVSTGRLLSPPIAAPVERIKHALARELALDAGRRLSLVAFEGMIGRFATAFPMPLFNLCEAVGSMTLLRVVRTLADEGVSVKDFRTIIAALLEIQGTIDLTSDELDAFAPTAARALPRVAGETPRPRIAELADYARLRIADQLCWPLHVDGTLDVRPFAADIRARLADMARRGLTPAEVETLAASIARNASGTDEGGWPILVAPYARRGELQCSLQRHLPGIQVLCPQELRAAGRVTAGSEIEWTAEAATPSGSLDAE